MILSEEVDMGLFRKLFGPRNRHPQLPPEVEEIFQKVTRFLTDEEAQNASLPESLRKVIEASPAVDEIPGSSGEFGRCASNPVPVNGSIGEISYISRLVTRSGLGLIGHRIGTIANVDVFETVSVEGKTWDILYFSLYHPRKSRTAPAGYRLSKVGERPPFVTCVNFRVDGFPLPMELAIGHYMRRILGFPARPPNLGKILASTRFVRPPDHNARLTELAKLSHFRLRPLWRDDGKARF